MSVSVDDQGGHKREPAAMLSLLILLLLWILYHLFYIFVLSDTWTDAWDCHKLQVPGLSYNWCGFQARILSRIAQTTAALTRLKPLWNDRSISLSSKIRLMRSLVTSIFLYACESWTLTAELQRRTQAMEMRCYRKILHFSCKDHVTNKEVRTKIQQAIGQHKDLLTMVKRRKLQ